MPLKIEDLPALIQNIDGAILKRVIQLIGEATAEDLPALLDVVNGIADRYTMCECPVEEGSDASFGN